MPFSKSGILVIGILIALLIGVIDYLIVIDISLSICYLIPIFIVTRDLDRQSGILLSVISATSWFIAEDMAKADLNIFLLLWNTTVKLIVFLIVVYLLSGIKNSYEREKKIARIDGLTKIYNRRYFLEILQAETKRSIRYHHCLTLVYFDVDNFKTVNDRFGHATGDKLLCLISHVVSKSIRETDFFARLGGDEFTLLLPETNYQAAQLMLKRIQLQLIKLARVESYDISFSIGAITFVEFPDSIDNMLEQVDALMYQVKGSGKNGLKHELCDSLLD